MRIGFDAKRAFSNFSGLGNYSRIAIESLAQYYPEELFFLFAPDLLISNFESIQFRKNIELISSNTFSKSFWRSYSQVNDWNKNKLNLFHGLSNELPFGLNRTETKKVVTIHDVIFKKHPDFYSFANRSVYDFKTKYACKNADRIICVSEQTKNDVIKYYKVPEKKLAVIYTALPAHITRMISSDKISEVKNKYQLPEKYILHVGTIEKRKNLLTVVKAMNHLKSSGMALVVVGKPTEYLNEIIKYTASQTNPTTILFIHYASNENLNVIYSQAHAFIYTSINEGFGIPLIEAGAHGVPAITSRNSCMQEASGNGALYVNPTNIDETAEAISSLFNNEKLRKELSAMALAHSSKFNSKNLATELMNLYKSV